MLARARTMMHTPDSLLTAEPLEGLAPIIVEELVVSLRKMIEDEGTAAILVEQHIEIALSHTADALVLARGRIVHRAPSSEFAHDAAKLERFVGLRIS